MNPLKCRSKFVWIFALLAVGAGAVPKNAFAQDERLLSKPDGPTPALTERERLLLEQVQQLAKRVAELEKKILAPTETRDSAGPANSAAVTASASPSPSPLLALTSSASAPATIAEVGKPPAPKKAEPFSFADFTWLNGNSRTKDTPYATSFFKIGRAHV